MPFYRLNKEYNQQGIYMSAPAPTTPSSDNTLPTVSPTGTASTKILSLVSQNGEDEPIGFALLMSPYKARLIDIGSATAGLIKRSEEITQGKSSTSSTDEFVKNLSESLSATDLNFEPTLYSTKQVNDRDAPRIIFPLPVDIRDQLLVNYQTSDLGIAGAAASFGADLAKNIKQGRGLDMGADSRNAVLAAAGLNILGTTAPGLSALAGQYLGQVLNPFTVTSFRNVEPRVFNFEFRITPRNADQSETLQECINTLRYCALPDPSASGLTLEFPYRFKLAWLGALKMFDFSESVLTRIEVNYASGGSPAFFEYTESLTEGASSGYHPVAVTINLEFRELFPLTKETVFPRRSESTYAGEMRPRKLGRDQIEGANAPPSSPATQGGATTTDPAENQTGAGDNALNTPVDTDRATVEQGLSILNDSAKNINASTAALKNEGDGGLDAFKAQQGLIPASEVYLAVNKHDTQVESYNNALEVLKSVAEPNANIKQVPFQPTWFEKVQAGTSGSRSGISVWQTQYDKGKADWNKTSGGGG
jgi:hypothetical protein